jgi:hypothetical protein
VFNRALQDSGKFRQFQFGNLFELHCVGAEHGEVH